MEDHDRGRHPPELAEYACRALVRLWEMADDPQSPDKQRMDIHKWFVELWYGKGPLCRQAMPQEPTETVLPVRFEGALEEWAK